MLRVDVTVEVIVEVVCDDVDVFELVLVWLEVEVVVVDVVDAELEDAVVELEVSVMTPFIFATSLPASNAKPTP